MPTRTKRPPVTPFAQQVRADLLDYLTGCVQHGTDPGSFPQIAARLGISRDATIRCINDLRREGEINYAWKKPKMGKDTYRPRRDAARCQRAAPVCAVPDSVPPPGPRRLLLHVPD